MSIFQQFKSAYVTVPVRKLGAGVRVEDVERHFGDIVSDPVVSPLIQDFDDRYQATTVTFKGKNKKDCKIMAGTAKRNKHLRDQDGHISKMLMDPKFRGLTPLACSTDHPQFDFCFIHGLAGDAWKTWVKKQPDHKGGCMWPQDLLPRYMEEANEGDNEQHYPLFGRYLAFGYEARFTGRNMIKSSLLETAEELLEEIIDKRPKNCTRPLFFACHSLGGLILCQALVLALQGANGRPRQESHFKALFQGDRCLVKGIAFFGTPFKGSILANAVALVGPVLRWNRSYITKLRIKDNDVASIVEAFEKIRQSRHHILLVIFFEKKPMTWFIFKTMVTERQSAVGIFEGEVRRRPIFKNHVNMVKFRSTSLEFHNKIGPILYGMIKKGLEDTAALDMVSMFGSGGLDTRTLLSILHGGEEHMSTAYMEVEIDIVYQSRGELTLRNTADDLFSSHSMQEIRNPREVDSILRIVLSGFDNPNSLRNIASDQIRRVQTPIPRSCNWILQKPLYKTWEAGPGDNVLFIEGEEGTGKSVMAKFIIEHLISRFADNSANVVYFFCSSVAKRNSPSVVLQHILLQLEQKNPGILKRAICSRDMASFGEMHRFDRLWQIFLAVREKLRSKIICVIDGLDECLRSPYIDSNTSVSHGNASAPSDASQTGGSTSLHNPITQFFKKLYDSTGTTRPESITANTAILFLTRPIDQVLGAVKGQSEVIKIEKSDIQEGVTRVIEAGAKSFGESENLPAALVKDISKALISKSESNYQWAALERLRAEHAEKRSYASIEVHGGRTHLLVDSTLNRSLLVYSRPHVHHKLLVPPFKILESFQLGIYSVYYEALAKIQSDGTICSRASLLVRLLVTAEADFEVDELQHATAIGGKYPEEAPTPLEPILQACREFVTAFEDGAVRFVHHSVRKFFLQLDPHIWPAFSCRDLNNCHAIVAAACINYLLCWPHQQVSQEEMCEVNGIRILAAAHKSPFIPYTAAFWTIHAKAAGALSLGFKNLVDQLLDPERPYYGSMYAVRRYMSDQRNDEDWVVESPMHFLVESNLIEFVRAAPIKTTKIKCRRLGIFRKSAVVNLTLDVDSIDSRGMTLLHVGAWYGKWDMVKYLLDCGARGDVYDHQGKTPFSLAVEEGHGEIAELLMDRNQSFERRDNKDYPTSLHMASCNGLTSVAEYLLLNRYNANSYSLNNRTPLQVAAEAGHLDIVNLLIRHQADIEATGNWPRSLEPRPPQIIGSHLMSDTWRGWLPPALTTIDLTERKNL